MSSLLVDVVKNEVGYSVLFMQNGRMLGLLRHSRSVQMSSYPQHTIFDVWIQFENWTIPFHRGVSCVQGLYLFGIGLSLTEFDQFYFSSRYISATVSVLFSRFFLHVTIC